MDKQKTFTLDKAVTIAEYLNEPMQEAIAERKRRKELIMDATKITPVILNHWRNNRTPVPYPAQVLIEKKTGRKFKFQDRGVIRKKKTA